MSTVTMDRAGRIVIPKALREELHLHPGDSLTLDTAGEQIILSPKREERRMFRKHGFWVMQGTGEPLPASIYDDVIDEIRREREESLINSVG